jgi:hypothetical protein
VGEHAGQDLCIVMRVVGLPLRDAPVAGEGVEAVVGHLKAQTTAQREGAQSLPDRQLCPGPFGFGGEESMVEGGVVGDQDAFVEDVENRG